MIRRLLAIFHARNIEFVRDRSSLVWNIALPILLVVGLGFIFSGGGKPIFTVGVLHPPGTDLSALHAPFLKTRYINFVGIDKLQRGLHEVTHDEIAMLVDLRNPDAPGYWINENSPKSYLLERILLGSGGGHWERRALKARQIGYIDWLVPGILGMNMMFSCFFGVGYVIVRYRKNGYLKRLNATPLTAFEFVAAQVASRLMLIMAITIAVYLGTDWLLDFTMEGSYVLLFVIALVGALSMISLSLLVSARITSEELAAGLLNLITWPTMVLSGIWFSLGDNHPALNVLAQFLPLTQLLEGARAVMLDGAGFAEVAGHLAILAAMSGVFLVAAAWLFKWKSD